MGELLVSADLLKKGYEVFRALSPGCSCDLVAMKNEKLIRVEVKTRQKSQGSFSFKTKKKADLLALVMGDKVLYKKVKNGLVVFKKVSRLKWQKLGM